MSIDLSSYEVEIQEIQPGETIRIDHDTCEAGEDTRRRLYLTRVQAKPDLVIGYCHNCQQNGIYHTEKYLSYRKNKHSTAITSHETIEETCEQPSNIEFNVGNWPSEAIYWKLNNKLTSEDIDKYGIGYDPTTNRIYIPRFEYVTPFNFDESASAVPLIGYQLRILAGRGPKYFTVSKKDAPSFNTIHSHPSFLAPSMGGVIVEDYISGIHICNAVGSKENVKILVNYGTQVNLAAMHDLKTCRKLVVWFDNDNSHVIKQATLYGRTFTLVTGNPNTIVTENTDPKHYSHLEIRETLGDCGILQHG